MRRLMCAALVSAALAGCATNATTARRNASLNVARIDVTKDPVRGSMEKERTQEERTMVPAQLPRTTPESAETPDPTPPM